MAVTWEDFKQCVKIQGRLDFEAVDFAVVEPLQKLYAWWQRQSAETKRYVNFFTGGLGALALTAFLKKVLGPTAAEASLELLGAAMFGFALGIALDILGRCGLQEIESSIS